MNGPTPPVSNSQEHLFKQIIRYYSACIKNDQVTEVSFFANQFKSLDWIEISEGPELSGLNADDLAARIKALPKLDQMLSGGGAMEKAFYFYGFPILANPIVSKKNNAQYLKVEPLFYLKLEKGSASAGTPWRFSDEPLEVNRAALRTIAPNPEEARELLEQLGLLGDEEYAGSLGELAKKIEGILGPAIWKEPLDAAKLICDGKMAEKTEGGLYNRGMLFKTEPDAYTRGLEKELAQLEGEKLANVQKTALGFVLGMAGAWPAASSRESTPLSHAIPLNENQEAAVRSALANRWTVITGPPGTGKSQVVSAILVNAALQGKSVLLTSRNHRAVDVVLERTNKLASRPLLLKLGRQSGDQNKLAEYIANLLAQRPSEKMLAEKNEVKAEIERFETWRTKIRQKMAELEALLNRAQDGELKVEEFRPLLGDDLRALKDCHEPSETMAWQRFLNYLGGVNRRLRLFPFLWTLKGARNALVNRLKQKMAAAPHIAGLPCFAQVDFSTASIADLRSHLDLARKVDRALFVLRGYDLAMDALREAPSLESLEKGIVDIQDGLVRKGSRYLELWSMCLAEGITDVQRQVLAQYRAGLATLGDGDLPVTAYRNLAKQMDEAFPIVSRYIPGWCVTNLSARGRVPFSAGMFDLVVIDEASQCDIPSVIPLLFRAKRAVVIGDPNQLQHITHMRAAKDLEFRQKHGLAEMRFEPLGYSKNSLFALAQSVVPGGSVVELNDHHRSHAEIIGFSNSRFYGERLTVATDYRKLVDDKGFLGLRWYEVKGEAVRPGSGGAINEIEAQEVAKQVVALIKDRSYPGSVGVVTPFRLQANRIRELVAKRLTAMEIESHDLIIDVVHRYQGDERDCMFFSPVVSAGIHEKSLGFLEGTGNLFNVAMTRARSVLYVVGDREACLECGVGHLEKFAAYTQALQEARTRAKQWGDDVFESVWEERLYRRLVQEGLEPMPQYQVGQYRLDLALIRGGISLDIEVDGERYHKDWTGSLCQRDLIRNMRLQEQGWKVERFWAYQVRDDLDYCVERVKAALVG